MNIEVGNFYKTRSGEKVQVIHELKNNDDCWLGYIINEGGDEESMSWYHNGSYHTDIENDEDIVCGWVDKLNKTVYVANKFMEDFDLVKGFSSFEKFDSLEDAKKEYTDSTKFFMAQFTEL